MENAETLGAIVGKRMVSGKDGGRICWAGLLDHAGRSKGFAASNSQSYSANHDAEKETAEGHPRSTA